MSTHWSERTRVVVAEVRMVVGVQQMVVVQMVVVVATVVAVEAATKAVQYNPGSLIRAPGMNNLPEFWLPDLTW